MFRLWWSIAVLCLSIWAIGSRALACASEVPPAPHDVSGCSLAVPSNDDASSRQWDAPVRTAAYLTQSVWTSQIHHAELASSPCLDSRVPLRAYDESLASTPHVIRPHVPTPLLI